MATAPVPGSFAWQPTEAFKRTTNWWAFLAAEGLRDYPALERKAAAEPEWFWDALIRFLGLRFQRPYTRVLDASGGIEWPRWCVGGRMNATESLLDRHLAAGRGAQEALLWEGEDGARRRLTYAEIAAEANRLAGGLAALGLQAGDRVGLYMPMVPEAAVALLGLWRLGCVALPLFSGFGAAAIAARLNDGDAAAVITADAYPRRGRTVPMKATLDEALAAVPGVRHVVVARRFGDPPPMRAGRDLWWDDLVRGRSAEHAAAELDAEHPLLIVYTSGTTGRPKGVVHTHCGLTAKAGQDFMLCFDLKAGDRLLWMTDLGWLVGPIQVLVGLLAGATVVMAEGAPDYPEPGRLWRLVQDHRVSFLGMAPTIARMMMRAGDAEVARRDLSSVRRVASTGEPWDHESWLWVFAHVLGRRSPVMNFSGGTEMLGLVATNLLYPIKPASFSGPIPGTDADIVDEAGRSVDPGEVGELVMRQACIGTTRGLWRDRERYLDSYWRRFPGMWVHGDWASRDADGSWFLHGRSDDTIKIAGKRTGPAEIEAALLATHRVSEAAAVAVPDKVKGAAVVCVVMAAPGEAAGEPLAAALSDAVAAAMGGAYRPKRIVFVDDLPRTRNMKVMRRVIRCAFTGGPPGDLTALVNPEAVDALRATLTRSEDAGRG